MSSCRHCDWQDPEIYILLVFDILYAYNALMLLFGLAHCCSLLCGGFKCRVSYSVPSQLIVMANQCDVNLRLLVKRCS
jgi:hypothetical protein